MTDIIDVSVPVEEKEEVKPETVQLDEVTFFKLKYFNESVVNKKNQADLATEAFKAAVNEASAKFSENGAFQVTGIDLDKGTVTRTKK